MARAKSTVTSPGKQTQVPGTEPPTYPDIEESADEFRAIRDAWQRVGKKMQTAIANLAKRMDDHGVRDYRFQASDGEWLKVTKTVTKEKVKVAKDKARGGDGDGPEVTGE